MPVKQRLLDTPYFGEVRRLENPWQGDVALVLNNKAAASLMNWQPISNRLLSARLAHSLGGLHAPTNEANDCDKDSFYQSFGQPLQHLNPADVILCLGDFNFMGTVRAGYESVVGPYGSGTPNDNTDRLLSVCRS